MDIFCKIVNGEIPSKKLYEDEIVMVIMDVNPTSNGHSLIIPKKHYQDLFDIEEDVLNHIMKVAKETAKKLVNYLRTNNLGRASFLPISSIKGQKISKINT